GMGEGQRRRTERRRLGEVARPTVKWLDPRGPCPELLADRRQKLRKIQSSRLGYAPRVHELSPDAVPEPNVALEDRPLRPEPDEAQSEGGAGDTAAHDNDLQAAHDGRRRTRPGPPGAGALHTLITTSGRLRGGPNRYRCVS